jgi:hypothetical protein
LSYYNLLIFIYRVLVLVLERAREEFIISSSSVNVVVYLYLLTWEAIGDVKALVNGVESLMFRKPDGSRDKGKEEWRLMLKEEEPNNNRSIGRVGGDGGLDYIIAKDKNMKEELDDNIGFDLESGESSSKDAYRYYI